MKIQGCTNFTLWMPCAVFLAISLFDPSDFIELGVLLMALNIGRDLVTSKTAEVEGVWRDYESGSKLLLARLTNENAQKARMEAFNEWRTLLERKTADGNSTPEAQEKMEEIEAEVIAKHVLKGWSGIEGDDGQEVPFTPETAEQYLNMSKDFRQDVRMYSGERASYLESSIAADTEKAKK